MVTKRRTAKRANAAKKTGSAVKKSAHAALSIATSARRTVRQRVAAMAEAPLAVCESDKDLQAMLDVLRNRDEPVKVRLAAFQTPCPAAPPPLPFPACPRPPPPPL